MTIRPPASPLGCRAAALAALVVGLASASLAACNDVETTKPGCPASKKNAEPCASTLEIDMQGAGDKSLPIGSYHFAFTYEGETFGTSCPLTGDLKAKCDPYNPMPSDTSIPLPTLKLDGSKVVAWQLVLPSAPESVDVKVLYQDDVAVEQTITPDYEEQRADPKCPVLCETSVTPVTLTFL